MLMGRVLHLCLRFSGTEVPEIWHQSTHLHLRRRQLLCPLHDYAEAPVCISFLYRLHGFRNLQVVFPDWSAHM